MQLMAYPQEKMYLHTDKPYYISGEKIWFRAHLADAVMHLPAIVSRYVYAELIDPLDSVVVRVKIRPEDNVHSGYMEIPQEVPEGNYQIRAYTNFMRSPGEDYFYTKTVRIGDPQARYIAADVRYEFQSGKKVTAHLNFFHPSLASPIVPEKVKVQINGGKQLNVRPEDNGTASVTFNLSAEDKQRVMLLEIIKDNHPYRQFFTIPLPDSDYDVSFYPEGGNMLTGILGRVAFKALKSDGTCENISGKLYDHEDNSLGDFKTDYQGIGTFMIAPEAGKSYYVVCENVAGVSKRFELPASQESGYGLVCQWMRDRLYVSIHHAKDVPHETPVYLLAHTRGLVHYVAEWDFANEFVFFPKEAFPSGVLHLLLLDRDLNPVSERLVFVKNDDQAQIDCQPDKPAYPGRSLVENRITLTDSEGNPLSGNFSVSVTDDKEVIPDSTDNIMVNLLLSSDLKGNIADPAGYFKDNRKSGHLLELLMLTNGWRRYDVSRILKKDFARPTSFLEIGPEISGTVKSVLLASPAGDMEVSMMALNGECFDMATTDENGRFYLRNCEYPDSTKIVVHVVSRTGLKRYDLLPDSENFPERLLPPVHPMETDRKTYIQYLDKAEQQYTDENGVRVIMLSEVAITADRKPVRKSIYYSQADNSITEDELEKYAVSDMRQILMRLPGVMVSGDRISIRGQGDPLLIVDGVSMDISDIHMINPYDVAQVDVLKNAGNTAIFGSRGGNGVIVVFTKEGKIGFKPKPFHIKIIQPLGFQKPLEFYAPKYDSERSKNSNKPDFRTTIHWQPSVQADESGTASFSFYTADTETTYSVIIEGLSSDGKIIYHKGKIIRK
jgi:TonB-dependent SusC/RagA subfamily outer membrane receptor